MRPRPSTDQGDGTPYRPQAVKGACPHDAEDDVGGTVLRREDDPGLVLLHHVGKIGTHVD